MLAERRVLIVGGGLAGLHAAYLLRRLGVTEVALLEAREGVGGRVLTVDARGRPISGEGGASDPADRFDLGPTWYWPGIQPELERLIEALGLRCFAQFEAGDLMLERVSGAAPVRVQGYASAPPPVRLRGGMGALVDALHRELDPSSLFTGRTVRHLRADVDRVEALVESGSGEIEVWRSDHVLLAVPPRLAAQRIGFSPPLPPALAREWLATPTWMAPHAKYLAIYDEPFWRRGGLSGSARSALGPLAEVHDASVPGGRAALFGFLGVPARVRERLSGEELRAHCRAQLARSFGPRAATPLAECLKDWAGDPWTATDADLEVLGHHGEPPPATAAAGPWRGLLTGIASEWSEAFPGYVAGAIDAAAQGVAGLTRARAASSAHAPPV